MTNKYFAYYSEDGLSTFATKQEAADYCNRTIDRIRKDGYGAEWSDFVESVCWGEIKQAAKEIDLVDYGCDFKLTDIGE
jgi:hypothetical protein